MIAVTNKLTVQVVVLLQVLLLSALFQEGHAYTLQGKRAIVTGCSGGIGRGIAMELAEAGAHVLVHYHERQEGARETARLISDRCVGIGRCDFCHPAQIEAWFEQQVLQLWPDGMDILVNNAARTTQLALQDEDNDELADWRDTLAINLHAPHLLSHLAIKGMKERGGGVIINVSSIHSNGFTSAYSVSKAGLDTLTKTMATEYAPYNIRVNSIAPGPREVERSEEVARATMPLITNDWMTGIIWPMDGGIMAHTDTKRNTPRQQQPQPPQQPPPPRSQNNADSRPGQASVDPPMQADEDGFMRQNTGGSPGQGLILPLEGMLGNNDYTEKQRQQQTKQASVGSPVQADQVDFTSHNGGDTAGQGVLPRCADRRPPTTTVDPKEMPVIEPMGGTSNPFGVPPKPKRRNGLGGTSDPLDRPGEQDSDWWMR